MQIEVITKTSQEIELPFFFKSESGIFSSYFNYEINSEFI